MEMQFWQALAEQLQLGKVLEAPRPVTGGFLHRMARLETSSGRYAVKLLNPFIMKRETAMENYRVAERLEAKLEQTDIPILPAMTIQGHKMQCIHGQYAYVYPWYEGKAVKPEEVTSFQAGCIGQILARIHRLEVKRQNAELAAPQVEWKAYQEPLQKRYPEIGAHFAGLLPVLYESQKQAAQAVRHMPPVLTICHNDMDCKNVLWQGETCRIIDLECLTYASPFTELYEMALSWSGFETGHLDYERLKCFLQAYAGSGGLAAPDWSVIAGASSGRLDWLRYNLDRALGIDCSPQEEALGAEQVSQTLSQIAYLQQEQKKIVRCLTQALPQKEEIL